MYVRAGKLRQSLTIIRLPLSRARDPRRTRLHTCQGPVMGIWVSIDCSARHHEWRAAMHQAPDCDQIKALHSTYLHLKHNSFDRKEWWQMFCTNTNSLLNKRINKFQKTHLFFFAIDYPLMNNRKQHAKTKTRNAIIPRQRLTRESSQTWEQIFTRCHRLESSPARC